LTESEDDSLTPQVENPHSHFASEANCSILVLQNLQQKKTASLEDLLVIDPKKTLLFLICILALSIPDLIAKTKPEIKKQDFGRTTEQEPVEIYTLTNASGAEARIMTYGGALVSVKEAG